MENDLMGIKKKILVFEDLGKGDWSQDWVQGIVLGTFYRVRFCDIGDIECFLFCFFVYIEIILFENCEIF